MKIKTLAYIPLHYGSEYLDAVIRSIDDHVDEILILYTDRPSYGQDSRMRNPDNGNQLRSIAEHASNKIKWVNIPKTTEENKHRKLVFEYARGFDLILAVDADEIWEDLDKAKEAAYKTGCENVNVAGSQWYHFWRSFNEVHRDGFAPTRFHVVNGKGNGVINEGKIYHMGYAQSELITEYKISCHGHKSIPHTWFREKWLKYKKGQTTHLHPDSQTVWIETEDFDKTTLPDVLKNHRYYNLDKIVGEIKRCKSCG
jgi:hypothetical protein